MPFLVGDAVCVSQEVQKEDGAWVTTSEQGIISEVDGDSVAVDWGTGEEPYWSHKRHVRRQGERGLRPGDRVTVELEWQDEEDGAWRSGECDARVISVSPGNQNVTLELPDSTEPYTTPMSFVTLKEGERRRPIPRKGLKRRQLPLQAAPIENDSFASTCSNFLPPAESPTNESRAPDSEQQVSPPRSPGLPDHTGIWRPLEITGKRGGKGTIDSLVCYHSPGRSLTSISENGLKKRRELFHLDGKKRGGEAGEVAHAETLEDGGIKIQIEGKGKLLTESRTLLSDCHLEIIKTLSVVKTGRIIEKWKESYEKVGGCNAPDDEDSTEDVGLHEGNQSFSSSERLGRELPASRLLLLDATAQSVLKESDTLPWVRFCSVLDSIITASYASLVDDIIERPAPQQLPLLLNLAAAAGYTPMSQQQWDDGGCTLKKATSDLAPQEWLRSHFTEQQYHWGREDTSSPTPDFQDKVLVLVRGSVPGQPHEHVLVARPPPEGGEGFNLCLFFSVPADTVAHLFPGSRVRIRSGEVMGFIGRFLLTLVLATLAVLSSAEDWLSYLVIAICLYCMAGQLASLWFLPECMRARQESWRVEHTEAKGSLALHRMLAQAEEKEVKEVVLAYFVLWREGENYVATRVLRTRISEFLTAFHIPSQELDLVEALTKLQALGLISSKGDMHRVNLTPKQYLTVRHRRWDSLLKNQLQGIIDSRIRKVSK